MQQREGIPGKVRGNRTGGHILQGPEEIGRGMPRFGGGDERVGCSGYEGRRSVGEAGVVEGGNMKGGRYGYWSWVNSIRGLWINGEVVRPYI